jgi:hypothetical protein
MIEVKYIINTKLKVFLHDLFSSCGMEIINISLVATASREILILIPLDENKYYIYRTKT